MEIGRGCRHVAQARHPHNIGLRQNQRAEDSLPLEQIAPDIYTLMAGTTAERFEHPVTVKFLGRQSRGIAVQPTVEPASGREQRSLKGHQRIQERGSIRRPAISLAKLLHYL